MAQFSTEASVSLEKTLSDPVNPILTPPEAINETYEIEHCVQWIRQNEFKKVCLQFPDHLLPNSTVIAQRLEQELGQKVYVLADTTYESCCIDYVTAAHVCADAIIHFGPICLSKSAGTIPNLNVYEKRPLDLERLLNLYQTTFNETPEKPFILLETNYAHYLGQMSRLCDVTVLDNSDKQDFQERPLLFIGDNYRILANLKFNYPSNVLFYYDVGKAEICNYNDDSRVLKRRYYLIEKIKDSHTIGIVIGTLGIENYLKLIERLKLLIKLHQKKYYLISVGKPTVAKLANFPEIDIYVMVTCALNDIYCNDRDYYKPIVTPYDVEMALNPLAANLNFSYDFNSFLNNPVPERIDTRDNCDVSLITGNVRLKHDSAEGAPSDFGFDVGIRDVALKQDGVLALNSNYGAGFLAERSWKGLEPQLGATAVEGVVEGRRGIAQGYSDEHSLDPQS